MNSKNEKKQGTVCGTIVPCLYFASSVDCFPTPLSISNNHFLLDASKTILGENVGRITLSPTCSIRPTECVTHERGRNEGLSSLPLYPPPSFPCPLSSIQKEASKRNNAPGPCKQT